MNQNFYLAIHLLGVIFLFLGLGSALLPADSPQRKIGLRLHGIGLVLLLFGGFGLIGKIKSGFAWWFWVKLALWFGFGAMPLLSKRGLVSTTTAYCLTLLCGFIAIILGVTQGHLDYYFLNG